MSGSDWIHKSVAELLKNCGLHQAAYYWDEGH